MLAAAIEAIGLVFSWPNILYPLFGTLIAMTASILPGISGVALMAVMIPLTIFWSPLEMALLFGALVGGATFMGSVSAILLNVPGKTSNAATAMDGYPLSQQGKAKTAIACSATASALGSTFGVIVLLGMLPFLIPLAKAFGPFDMLVAIIWGLSTIAFVVSGSWLKGLSIAGLGLLVSFIGPDQQTGEYRFVFATSYLKDGLSPILVFLGLFAVAEMMELSIKKSKTISGHTNTEHLSGSAAEGINSVFKHFKLFLRCSAIGTVVGMMPGVGATVASFVAYGHATQSTKKPSSFGSGDIRGVIAPEAANDAKDGGSLVPTLAIGLPGGMGTAMLLTAFSVHGITPGPNLLVDNIVLVFVLIWSLFLSNWLTSILGLAGVSWFARITTIPNSYLIPAVLSLVSLSAYSFRGSTLDVLVVFGSGVFGYYLKKYDWPRVPFVIAFILGPHFDNQFHVSRQLFAYDRIDFTSAPMAIVLGGLTIIGIVSLALRKRQEIARPRKENHSAWFTIFLIIISCALLVQSVEVSQSARLLPLWVGGFTLATLGMHFYSLRFSKRASTSGISSGNNEALHVIGIFLLGITVIGIGPLIAIPVYFAGFLVVRNLASRHIVTATIIVSAITFLFMYYVSNKPVEFGMMSYWF